MKFQKIQLTKANTLNVVYRNDDGDVVTVNGANIVHKDLRQAMHALIPHLAIVTEQREAADRNLKQVQSDRITDDNNASVFKRLDVDTISFSDDETVASISGCRILMSGSVIKLASPNISLGDDEHYQYHDELSIDIQAVTYEAKLYLTEKKWGIKQAEIAFEDPFEGVQAGDVPITDAQKPKTKKTRKSKKDAA